MTHTGSSHPALSHLRFCRDTAELRASLQTLCARFGTLAQLDILASRQPSGEQAMCFLRMQTPQEEYQLMAALGLGRFGGDIVLVVDLPPRGDALRPSRSANQSGWGTLEDSLPTKRRQA